jgi:hypothetical protein
MDRVVLNNLSFELDLAEVMQALHVRPQSSHAQVVARFCEEARSTGRPKAIYRLGYIEDRGNDHVVVEGIRFSSRVLRVNLDRPERVFAFVCTAGVELEEWTRAKPDLLEQFWADTITERVLLGALAALERHLKELFAVDGMSQMTPGSLPDWPLGEQRPLFAMLGETKQTIGVALTKSLLMTPSKTVSGIMFPTEETFASCQLCQRTSCPNRRAPYDPQLFATRFAETEVP